MTQALSSWAVALALVATPALGATPATRGLQPGRPLPPFCFDAAQGRVCTGDFRGRTLALNLWATWCRPCVRELPLLDRLQRQHGAALAVVALAVDRRGWDAVRQLRGRLGIMHLQEYLDADAAALGVLGARGIPLTLLVDAGGTVRRRYAAELDEPALRADLAALLDQRMNSTKEPTR